ncbi:MAG: HAD-IIIA family hydrolase [Spirochaetes bacterium]|nr:HAD-IIIA family hydrolase [Spirochaetota bacterium]
MTPPKSRILRIAQLTDFHLRRKLPGSSFTPRRRSRLMPAILEAALAEVRAAKADFIAVTGDLVDVPGWLLSGDDYYPYPVKKTLIQAIADYRLIKRLLDATGIPYLAVPGNHDHLSSFYKVFPHGPWERDLHGLRILAFPDREHEAHHAQRLDAERLRWERALSDGDPRPQLHLAHYLITPEHNEGYPHNYLESASLLTANTESGKHALVLQGHFHPGSRPEKHGNMVYATAPTLCVAPHPWRLYTLAMKGERFTLQWKEIRTRFNSFGSAAAKKPRSLRDDLRGRRSTPKPVVFLDRDGVINTLPAYYSGPDQMKLIPGSAEAIRRLHGAGYAVVVVSNQSCVGAGYVTRDQLAAVFDRMNDRLAAEGGEAALPEASYFTLGAGERAVHPKWAERGDAKPSPALLEKARRELGLSRKANWMVGDRLTDLQAGAAAGCRNILVLTGHGSIDLGAVRNEPSLARVAVAKNLAAAVDLILGA